MDKKAINKLLGNLVVLADYMDQKNMDKDAKAIDGIIEKSSWSWWLY